MPDRLQNQMMIDGSEVDQKAAFELKQGINLRGVSDAQRILATAALTHSNTQATKAAKVIAEFLQWHIDRKNRNPKVLLACEAAVKAAKLDAGHSAKERTQAFVAAQRRLGEAKRHLLVAPRITRLVIDVIDNSNTVADWFSRKTTSNAIHVKSVNDMVNKVIARASVHGLGSIRRLNIDGHGAPGEQSVGSGSAANQKPSKSLGWLNIPRHRGKLQKLRPYFAKDAVVTLLGCKVARGVQGESLLRKLHACFRVPVQGGIDNQYPLIPGMEGKVRRFDGRRFTLLPPTYIGTPGNDGWGVSGSHRVPFPPRLVKIAP